MCVFCVLLCWFLVSQKAIPFPPKSPSHFTENPIMRLVRPKNRPTSRNRVPPLVPLVLLSGSIRQSSISSRGHWAGWVSRTPRLAIARRAVVSAGLFLRLKVPSSFQRGRSKQDFHGKDPLKEEGIRLVVRSTRLLSHSNYSS